MDSLRDEPYRYAILGTGALGGYYGGLLARAGLDTHFLLRSDVEHVRHHGLRVDSIRGNFLITAETIQAYDDPAALPACDVAVVCLKTTQNDQLPALLARCVKPGGVVLVLQNGLQPEADAAAIIGEDRLLGGLCFLCSNKVGPGHIQHLDYGHIHLGVYAPAPAPGSQSTGSPAATHFRGIVDDFNAAGIETTGVEDLRLSRWKKLVWNIPYNGLSVVLNQTTDVMMADPPTRRRIEGIMHEVQSAALAVDGKVIKDEFIETMLDYTAKMEPYKTSMIWTMRRAGRWRLRGSWAIRCGQRLSRKLISARSNRFTVAFSRFSIQVRTPLMPQKLMRTF
ncbi:MAG: 2-dehydropantoate 2-reductase [Planctomycetota bacterium]